MLLLKYPKELLISSIACLQVHMESVNWSSQNIPKKYYWRKWRNQLLLSPATPKASLTKFAIFSTAMGKPTWEVPGNHTEWVMVDGSCKNIHLQMKCGLKLYSGHVRGKRKTVTKKKKKKKRSWYIGGILYDAQVVLKPLVPGLFLRHASWYFCMTWKQLQNNTSKVLEHLVLKDIGPDWPKGM